MLKVQVNAEDWFSVKIESPLVSPMVMVAVCGPSVFTGAE